MRTRWDVAPVIGWALMIGNINSRAGCDETTHFAERFA